MFDLNGDGEVSLEEFKKVCIAFSTSLSNKSSENLFNLDLWSSLNMKVLWCSGFIFRLCSQNSQVRDTR